MSKSRKYQRWFVLTFWYETLVFFHRPLYSMKVFLMTNLTNQQLARDSTTIPQNLLSSTLIVSVLKRSSVDSSFWFHSLLFQKTCRIVNNEKHSVGWSSFTCSRSHLGNSLQPNELLNRILVPEYQVRVCQKFTLEPIADLCSSYKNQQCLKNPNALFS